MTTEIKSEEPVIIERTLSAPVAKVWKALTDVDQMRQWYFDLKEFKPEVGFEFEFVVEHEGTTYHHLCRVTEVISENAGLCAEEFRGWLDRDYRIGAEEVR